jgi:methyl-accepting chemotaxis protein
LDKHPAEEESSLAFRPKIIALVTGMWVVVATFSYFFIQFVFDFSLEQSTAVSLLLWIGALVAGGLSLALVLRIHKPYVEFLRHHASGGKVPEPVLARAVSAAPRMPMLSALVGLAGPILWMGGTGMLAYLTAEGVRIQIPFLMVLGLFDAMLMSAMLFMLPQVWTRAAQELLAGYRSDALAGQGMSLTWKIGSLGLMLATIPTLLVGSMSYYTADRLLDQQVGRALQERLVDLSFFLDAELAAGTGRLELEQHLTKEADKLGPTTYLHLGTEDGAFFRSERAEPLPPGLYERIQAQRAKGLAGTVVASARAGTFAYAFSDDGRNVVIAPVRSTDEATAHTLLFLIVGITLSSMLVAGMVGLMFARSLGQKLRTMAALAEEVAHGKLSRDVRVVSDDELGVLGASLYGMTANLRRMVRSVTAVAGQIASTCEQLQVKAEAIARGADLQSHAVGETSQSVGELDTNIQSASDNLQRLAESAQETAEAAHKVGESYNLMLTEMAALQDTVERTGQIVGRMVGSFLEVASIIAELSDGAARSATSMSEMDRSISAVTSRAGDTAQIARKAIEAASDGAASVRRTINGMDRIVGSTLTASEVIQGLGNRIEAIGGILGVIEDIADQTNLLALNAAIIAAQAGEHGRSFAVVADEIRSLAERTSTSTREIGQMIADIQEGSGQAIKAMREGMGIVNEGVSLAKQAGDSLNQILTSVQRATQNVEEIAQNTESQAAASELVTREMAQVAEMAGRISQAAVDQTRAGQQLQEAFQGTLQTTRSLSSRVNQQAQESRLALSSVAAMNEAASRAHEAMLAQSTISEGILAAIHRIEQVAKEHAGAAADMGGGTQTLGEKSDRLKEEIAGFDV